MPSQHIQETFYKNAYRYMIDGVPRRFHWPISEATLEGFQECPSEAFREIQIENQKLSELNFEIETELTDAQNKINELEEELKLQKAA